MPPPTGEGLPETTFAFLRDVREGTTWKATHLYSIDLNTKVERLITTFPESGGTGAPRIIGLWVPPDRRQLAFGSAEFRPTIEDKQFPFEAGILWAVSSDGKTFTRLTPPITDAYHMGGYCGPGIGFCGYGESCERNYRRHALPPPGPDRQLRLPDMVTRRQDRVLFADPELDMRHCEAHPAMLVRVAALGVRRPAHRFGQ